jgi:iron complex transport system substrate-binding protein
MPILCFCVLVALSANAELLPPGTPPQRIVSLSPSLTEILFAVGAGDRVVGVTSFCDYPPEARDITRVGDHLSPNVEAIVRVNPDLVIMLPSAAQLQPVLNGLGIKTLMLQLEGVEDILRVVESVGTAVGCQSEAMTLKNRLQSRLMRQTPSVGGPTPRVLIVVNHDAPRMTGFSSVYIAGRDGFYDRLISLAGGTNAYDGALKYPQLSREGLLRLAPDILIDIVPDPEAQRFTVEQVREGWKQTFKGSAAPPVVTINTNDYVAIPGPRVMQLLDDFNDAVRKE